MMTLRPMVVSNGHVIGGNMRLKAIIDLGIKEVPDEWVKYEDLSEEKEKEFIIKDNVGFGEWEWDTLANEWDEVQLTEWGLEVWQAPTDINMDEFFAEKEEQTPEGKHKIVLEYGEEDYQKAIEAFGKHGGSREKVVLSLLLK
jgi:hypothetical protein